MTKEDGQWIIGIIVAIAAVVLPLVFSRKKMSQSQEQHVEGKGSQKQSQKMED